MRSFRTSWPILLAGHALALALMLAWTLPAHAQQQQRFENLDRLDSIVATTVGAGIGQPGGAVAPLDRRLRLAACPHVPSVEGPLFGAAMLRCDAIGWRIRVPLVAQIKPGQGSTYGRAAPQERLILIKKGDPVQLVAGDATFSVSRAMIADDDGAVGEMIRVRADKNTPAVTGRVEPSGIVRIPGI